MAAAWLWPGGQRVAAQEACAPLMAEAVDAFDRGQLDVALDRTGRCLGGDPSSGDEARALALRVRVHLALDQVDEAQAAIERLLAVDPEFAPALDDPARFRALVNGTRQALAREGVSSVSKMTESVAEAPATVVVLTGEQIRQRGYRDLEEVLHDFPGFSISRTGGQSYSNLNQRGYGSDATNRTLFLVDGVEQNDLFSNVAYISRQYPLSNIDRIEVVYGPASTMYGANAFLGVINVLTRDPDEALGETRNFAVDAHVGGGAWNTRWFDGTMAGRARGASFSLTARAFRSDDWDLSKFDEWGYRYGPALYERRFRRVSESVAARAVELDGPALGPLNGAPLAYSDLADDWMISGKLKIDDFLFGVQMWETREGTTSASTQWAEPGARNGNIWVPRQTSLYARYATALPGGLRLSYFGQAKVHELAPDSSAFMLQSYISGLLGIRELFRSDEFQPYAFWAQTRLAQSSNQLRHEGNVLYRPRTNLSVVGGIDLRHGSVQTDYAKSSNCSVVAATQLRIPDGVDPLDVLTTDGSQWTASERLDFYFPVRLGVFERAGAFLGVESNRVRCTREEDRFVPLPLGPQVPDAPPPVSEAGPFLAVRELGAFAQMSYNPTPNVKLVAGGRFDNGRVGLRLGRSYGTVFTPRLAFVYSPGGLVFKAAYAEAFKEPSHLERFSTIPPGIRDRAPDLEPERVRNMEVGVGHQSAAHSVDVSVYRASYSNVIGVRVSSIYDQLNADYLYRFSDRYAEQWYFDPSCGYLACLANALEQLPDAETRRTVVESFLNFPVFHVGFENLATLNVTGGHVNATWRYRGFEWFGNYTHTNTVATRGSASAIWVGDTARHQGTFGMARGWRNLSGSLRVNMIGPRHIERPTLGVLAYLAAQGTRFRYSDPFESRSSGSTDVDPYAVAHASVTYAFTPGLSLQATINNLFDVEYADPGIQAADNERFAARVPQPGRAMFLRLLTRF